VPIFDLETKIIEKSQTLGLALNCYFLYTVLCHVIFMWKLYIGRIIKMELIKLTLLKFF